MCGKWTGAQKCPAVVGNCHGFGAGKDNCVICDKWCGTNQTPGVLCNTCGFGNKKDNCAKNLRKTAFRQLGSGVMSERVHLMAQIRNKIDQKYY